MTVDVISQIALTGGRRTEMTSCMWTERRTEGSCLRLVDTRKRVESTHWAALVRDLRNGAKARRGTYVFPGRAR